MFISFAIPGFIPKYGCHKHDPGKMICFTITKNNSQSWHWWSHDTFKAYYIYCLQVPMLSVFLPLCHSNPPFSPICQEPPSHHHIAHPSNHLVHLTHISSIRMVSTTKIWSKAGMVHLVGRCANRMGSSCMFEVGSRLLLALMMQQS